MYVSLRNGRAHISTIGYLLIFTIVRSVLNTCAILIGKFSKEGNSHFSLSLSLSLSLFTISLFLFSHTFVTVLLHNYITLCTFIPLLFHSPAQNILGDGGAEWTAKEKSNIKLYRTFCVSM